MRSPLKAFRPVVAGIGIALLVALVVTARPQAPQGDSSVAPGVRALDINPDRGAAVLWQSLLKLHTRASLLMVTAHPDDEDGGMLDYESRGQGARAALLTLDRGEGGQNVMSDDYWDALGLVRTEELLAAGGYYGVQQYFTRVIDFGFSKTREEAMAQWGRDRVLYDAVRVVRMTRPLVVTSVFVGGHSDGHGQHMVAGQVAQEVYKLAGDPKVFPEQLKDGLRPWTPLKVYSRVPFRITGNTIFDYADGHTYPLQFYNYIDDRWETGKPATNLQIPSGDYDALLGYTFTQVAREGLGYQKSQNGGTNIPAAAPVDSPYHRWASRIAAKEEESSFFDGIDTSLNGIGALASHGDPAFLKAGLKSINATVEQAMASFSPFHIEKVAPLLASGLKATNSLLDQVNASSLPPDEKYDVAFELRVKQAQFNSAVLEALGIEMQNTVATERRPAAALAPFTGLSETFQTAIPGQSFPVDIHLANQSPISLELKQVWLAGPEGERWVFATDGKVPANLAANQATDVHFKVTLPENAAATKPYFYRPDTEQPYYDILDPRYLSLPSTPYPLTGWAEFLYEGVSIRVGQVVQTVKRETGLGNVLDPLVVAPPVSVSISPIAGIVPLDATTFSLSVTVHSNVKGPAKGTVRLDLPPSWHASPQSIPFATSKDGEDQAVSFQVEPASLQQTPYDVTAVASYDGKDYREGYHTAGYSGLRPYNLYRPATYRTTGTDVKVPSDLNVAYVTGTGDDVPKTLEMIGIRAHFLSAQDIISGDLSKYDVILLGVRAYAARPELASYSGRLLDYVKNGGVVVAQYESMEYAKDYGPYPYTLTNDAEKVVDETSPVVLDTSSPVLNWPNKISAEDFKGWIEERGHDFMKSWDAHYETPIETHDPDQEPQKGGLLVARYGKGVYVYTAFAFYRELTGGVPGAFRLFANLVSLPRNPQEHAGSANP